MDAKVKILGGSGYRLLTEAEWEYVARAGTNTVFPWGNSLSSTQANFNGNYPYGGARNGPYIDRTTKVGSYEPNAWGLHDTAANVSEWVWDVYTTFEYREYATQMAVDPIGRGTTRFRVIRGGNFLRGGEICRPAARGKDAPSVAYPTIGFRVARGLSRE